MEVAYKTVEQSATAGMASCAKVKPLDIERMKQSSTLYLVVNKALASATKSQPEAPQGFESRLFEHLLTKRLAHNKQLIDYLTMPKSQVKVQSNKLMTDKPTAKISHLAPKNKNQQAAGLYRIMNRLNSDI